MCCGGVDLPVILIVFAGSRGKGGRLRRPVGAFYMSPNPAAGWPDDPELLVRIANDATASPATRDRARLDLQPFIVRTARRVAAGTGAVGRDLIEECEAHVLERLDRFNPSRQSTFAAWCYAVLRNRQRDLMRRRRTHRPDAATALEERPDPASGAGILAFEMETDLATSLSAADLQRIGSWKPIDQIVLLSLGLLWRKVPVNVWERTLRACGLEPPFPPDELQNCGSLKDRHEFLAEVLGWPSDRLAQRWYRGRDLLDGLDFIKELRNG
jgi:DNA-directed RNA polymerase specialized sigma24 family protein